MASSTHVCRHVCITAVPVGDVTSSQVNAVTSFCAKMPRQYRAVCADDRERIIRAYRDGNDYVTVARQLGVKRTTAWSVVAKWVRTGDSAASPRGGNQPRKIDNDMIDFYLMLIDDDPTITLKRINEIVRASWPHKPRVSTSTISRALHGSLITTKQIRNIPADRNKPSTKESRVR